MTDFSWRQLLAARPADAPVLIAAGKQWQVGEIQAELPPLIDRLGDSRVVAVLADNGPAWVMADLAIQDARKVHLPLPAFFNAAQLHHALSQSAADTVLTDQPERIGALDLGFGITGSWQGLTWMRRVVAPAELPAGTAKVSFTSGSTGDPKGVCLSAEGLLDTARAVQERLADLALTHHLAVLPLALLLENVAGIYAPLLRGMPIHLPTLQEIGWRGMSGFDPAALDATVRNSAAASLILVPELLKAWISFLAHFSGRPQQSLQFVAVGGARVTPGLLQAARQLGIPAYQGYGLTEGGSVVTLNRPGDDADDVGRPLGHAQIRIEDGEVVVRTRAFLGYAGTASASSGDFMTGDLGHLDAQGHLHLAGRRKNLLITSFGRNISPEWVEAILLGTPAIRQAVVVGDGQPVLSAVIVPIPGVSPATIDASLTYINQSLPDYARIGGWIASEPFTADNGMATGNGRPIRQRIAEHHAAEIAALYTEEENTHAVL